MQPKLIDFLESRIGVPFTLDGRDNLYTIQKVDGFGYHVKNEFDSIECCIDEVSDDNFIVFTRAWMGQLVRKTVMVSNIQFMEEVPA